MRIPQYLELYVAGIGQVFFDVDVTEAEGGRGYRLGRFQGLGQLPFVRDYRHADAPSAAGGLDDHRVSDLVGDAPWPDRNAVTHSSVPGTTGTPAFIISRRAATLSPMRASTLPEGPMNFMPSRSQASGRTPGFPRGSRNRDGSLPRRSSLAVSMTFCHVEIALAGRGGTDAIGLIGILRKQRLLVRLRIDGHGGDAHLPACPHDTDRYLAAVGDENLAQTSVIHHQKDVPRARPSRLPERISPSRHPPWGERICLRIFIASIIATRSPLFTESPTLP